MISFRCGRLRAVIARWGLAPVGANTGLRPGRIVCEYSLVTRCLWCSCMTAASLRMAKSSLSLRQEVFAAKAVCERAGYVSEFDNARLTAQSCPFDAVLVMTR